MIHLLAVSVRQAIQQSFTPYIDLFLYSYTTSVSQWKKKGISTRGITYISSENGLVKLHKSFIVITNTAGSGIAEFYSSLRVWLSRENE